MPVQYIPDAFGLTRVEENFIQCGKKQWLMSERTCQSVHVERSLTIDH
jgi:hypothetical protein